MVNWDEYGIGQVVPPNKKIVFLTTYDGFAIYIKNNIRFKIYI
jgi:hypothetical protein